MNYFARCITTERTSINYFTVFRISRGSAIDFCHFVCKLAAFCDIAALTGLRRITGGSLPVMPKGVA